METLKRPLIPLDGSKASHLAFAYAQSWLTQAERILLLHVVNPDPTPATDVADEYDGPAARNYLKRVATDGDVDQRVELLVEAGAPAESIIDVANRERATMIVMATRGAEGVARWALGSHTERVLRSSSVPVLVVPCETRAECTPPSTHRHILLPVESGERALALVPHVMCFAMPTKARLTLAHFIEEDASALAEEQGREQLDRARRAFEDAGLLPHTRIVRASAAEGILTYGQSAPDDELPIDLIAMTTRGRKGVTRWALGSVTEHVMRDTTLPMLIVRSHT